MFNSKEAPEYQRHLEEEYIRVLRVLKMERVPTEEYAQMLSIVERFHEMMDKEKPSSVSKDTLLVVAANLVGIIMIIKHEHVNVITSRALNFVLRTKTQAL